MKLFSLADQTAKLEKGERLSYPSEYSAFKAVLNVFVFGCENDLREGYSVVLAQVTAQILYSALAQSAVQYDIVGVILVQHSAALVLARSKANRNVTLARFSIYAISESAVTSQNKHRSTFSVNTVEILTTLASGRTVKLQIPKLLRNVPHLVAPPGTTPKDHTVLAIFVYRSCPAVELPAVAIRCRCRL
jgi:hypothetical protein